MFSDGKKGWQESDYAYQLRKERVAYVKRWCDAQGVSAPMLQDRGLRNSLTHVDEHLADALERTPMTGWFIDVAIDSRSGLNAPDGIAIAFCRSYIRDEDKIVHLEHELAISDLEKECRAILAVVFGIDAAHA